MKRFEGARRKFPLNFVVSIIIVVLQVPRISLLTLLLTVNSWEQLQVEDRQHIINKSAANLDRLLKSSRVTK